MKRVILDTNVYRLLFEAKDEDLLRTINEAQNIFLSAIVLGELITGFKRGSGEKKNKDVLEEFMSEQAVEILNVGQETANIYGEIKYYLDKKGTPIPTNDIWIASQAIETGSVLITYDKHFLKIPGLRVWDRLKLK